MARSAGRFHSSKSSSHQQRAFLSVNKMQLGKFQQTVKSNQAHLQQQVLQKVLFHFSVYQKFNCTLKPHELSGNFNSNMLPTAL
jgi:hypothetical protein